MYREGTLARHGLDATALIEKPLSGVVGLCVSDVRSEGLDVVEDAYQGEPKTQRQVRDKAHALIDGLRSLSKNQQQRRADRLAKRAAILIDPA